MDRPAVDREDVRPDERARHPCRQTSHRPIVLAGSIALLRPFKAGLIALQYRHDLLDASRKG
jgi:hypothetical protein